jgi:hypothetical protein
MRSFSKKVFFAKNDQMPFFVGRKVSQFHSSGTFAAVEALLLSITSSEIHTVALYREYGSQLLQQRRSS